MLSNEFGSIGASNAVLDGAMSELYASWPSDTLSSSKFNETFHRMHTPKQTSKQKADYQYYAGFSNDFVVDILQKYGQPGSRVLDPWNGSGMTTSVCSSLGYESVGMDINPATIPVAWSRLVDPNLKNDLCTRIANAPVVFSKGGPAPGDDFMEIFFDEDTCVHLRGLRNWLVLVCREMTENLNPHHEKSVSGVGFVLLAETFRELLRPMRGTNPSWFSRPKKSNERLHIDPAEIKKIISQIASKMAKSIIASNIPADLSYKWPEILQGDTKCNLRELGYFDLVISSPPYCTRIDYAVATTPELLALGSISSNGFDDLRKKIMGALVTETCSLEEQFASDSLTFRTMLAITNHPTKAASTYYSRYFSRYFNDLAQSITEITNSMNAGHLALVVQNSYFKDVKIDLAAIVIEIVERRGLLLSSSRQYPARPTIAESNPRSRQYRNLNIRTEEVLIFRK